NESGSVTFNIAASTEGDPTTKATVDIKQEMRLPKWAERDKQCPEVRSAWDSFYSALKTHEDGHAAINRTQFAGAHKRYKGKAASSTESVTSELEAAANSANAAYDTRTDHGRKGTPPTTIDLGVHCKDARASSQSEGARPAEAQAK